MATRKRERSGGEFPPFHVAVGYTDRESLDRFIEGEQGDVVVHGPIHAGAALAEVATLGTGVTEGTPCLVVPLIRERLDEIRQEVTDVLDRFQPQRPPAGRAPRPHTIGETGGDARGTSAGAVRRGSTKPGAR